MYLIVVSVLISIDINTKLQNYAFCSLNDKTIVKIIIILDFKPYCNHELREQISYITIT